MQAKCMKVWDAGRSSTQRCEAAAKLQDQKSQSQREQAGPPKASDVPRWYRAFDTAVVKKAAEHKNTTE